MAVDRDQPNDLRVLLNIGDRYLKAGAKQDAIDTYLTAARSYQARGDLFKALVVYRMILKLDRGREDVRLQLAELYRQLGHTPDP